MPLFTSPPKSLCIIRLSAIGDVCHAIAAVQAIQRAWPTTHITWVTGKLEAQLLRHIKNVEIVIFDKKEGLQAYIKLHKRLKNKHFTALLHMQAALRSSLVSLCIKAPIKIGFDKERANDGQWLFTNTKIAQSSSPHVLDGFMSFITKLGIKDIEPRWKINIPSEVLERTQNIINNKKTFIICPATSKTYKNWTREGYCTLAQHALKKGFQVLICGANTEIEHDFANYIVQKTQKKAITLIAKTSLIELLALIQKSNLILAPDTGAIHMATMVGTPVIGLYAHHNPQRTGPYHAQENVVSVYEYFICKETHKNIKQLSWRARVKNKHAMQKIPEKSVIDLFNKITFKLI